ncbi:hypothetical protein [Psychromonas sp. SP041]|uniref:hypothetical protein n=1 Tax=Psychromonas sp. SP041 TaxID=1365007 RepID=UPI0010C793DA|nr:hypothetical protein [Psychromonas sp. SP041]
MQLLKKNTLALSVSTAVLTMTGCSALDTINDSKKTAESDEKRVVNKIKQAETMTRSATTVSVIDDMYVAGSSFRMDEKDTLPDFFNEPTSFSQLTPFSFQEIISEVQLSLNTRVELTDDAISYIRTLSSNSNQQSSGESSVTDQVNFGGSGIVGSELTFSLQYDGTVAGLLNYITAKANLYWKWKGNKIVVFRHETKQHIFDGDSSENNFEAKMSSTKSAGESSSTSASSESSESGQTTSVTKSSGNQFDDVIQAIESMISDEGRFSVSEQQGIITVTDTPDVQEKISEYIEQINAIINKKIAVKTTIYEITSDNTGDYGIDLDVAYDKVGSFSSSLASTFYDSSSSGATLSLLSGNAAGSEAMINALSTITNISKKTSTINYSKNGKTIPVQVASEQGYVEESTPTFNDDGDVTGYDVSTASILTGVTMNITPKVNSQGQIDIKFAADLSQLDSLETVNLDVDSDSDDDDSSSSNMFVQVPEKSFKSFIQDVTIRSGKSLVVAGFERETNESSVESIAGEDLWALGGSKEGGKTRVMSLIVITPYIMEN